MISSGESLKGLTGFYVRAMQEKGSFVHLLTSVTMAAYF